jgi:hypothetical protein
VVSPADPQLGQAVTVALDGYLTREQPWEGGAVALWPCRGEDEASDIADLVYGLDRRPLIKWAEMEIEATLEVIGDEWAGQVPWIRGEFDQSFAEIEAAGGPRFRWSTEASAPGLQVPGGPGMRIIVDRWNECLEEEYVACGQWWRNGSTITRAELSFDSPEMARDRRIRMRLLGHAIGLSGTYVKHAVMTWEYQYRGDQFHDLETTALRMMYTRRRPGNLLPDRDPAFASAEAGVREERVVEGRPR